MNSSTEKILVPESERLKYIVFECVRVDHPDKSVLLIDVKKILREELKDHHFIIQESMCQAHLIFLYYKFVYLQFQEGGHIYPCRNITDVNLFLLQFLTNISICSNNNTDQNEKCNISASALQFVNDIILFNIINNERIAQQQEAIIELITDVPQVEKKKEKKITWNTPNKFQHN